PDRLHQTVTRAVPQPPPVFAAVVSTDVELADLARLESAPPLPGCEGYGCSGASRALTPSKVRYQPRLARGVPSSLSHSITGARPAASHAAAGHAPSVSTRSAPQRSPGRRGHAAPAGRSAQPPPEPAPAASGRRH